jgi:hypothetical protein
MEKMNWVCPKCLSEISTGLLTCSCGLSINEELADNFRTDITPDELLKEIDNYSFLGAKERATLLSYYLAKRFPQSIQAQKIDFDIDINSTSAIDNYFRQKPQIYSNMVSCPDCGQSVSKRAPSCPHCGCPVAEIISANPDLALPAQTVELQMTQAVTNQSYPSNKPRCPTCGSTNIERISLTSKVGKVALVGIFAIGRVAKSYKCNNCKHQW